jgi:hypothetical protein
MRPQIHRLTRLRRYCYDDSTLTETETRHRRKNPQAKSAEVQEVQTGAVTMLLKHMNLLEEADQQ